MRSYPVMLELSGRRVVIIGAGQIALRKVGGFIGCGAEITVVAPEDRPESLESNITYIKDKYDPKYLKDALIVYACTDDIDLNAKISADARNLNILVNSVDDPQNCDFYAPSQIIRDNLTVAISTSAKAPGISKYLRKKLTSQLPQHIGPYIELVSQIRNELKSNSVDVHERNRILQKLASDEFLNFYINNQQLKVDELKQHILNFDASGVAQLGLHTSQRIICVGISHQTASVDIREKFAVGENELTSVLKQLKENWPESQSLVLSTCNRCEIYCIRKLHSHPRNEDLLKFFAQAIGKTSLQPEMFYTYEDSSAVEHICKVTAGLDSLVPGEDQIVAQIKHAWNASLAAGTCQKNLNLLLQTAIHTAKHIRSETNLLQGRTSVSSTAVDLVEDTLGTIENKNVVVVGAGQTASLAIKHLKRLGEAKVTIVRKNPQDKSQLPADKLPQALTDADLVICASSNTDYLITTDLLKEINPQKPILIIDLAVPRDVQTEAGMLDNITLFDIDSLERIVEKHKTLRLQSASEAEKIIQTHIEKLFGELGMGRISPTLEAMYHRTKQIEKQELQTAFKKIPSDSPQAQQKLLKHTLHRTVRRILHPLVEKLRTNSTNPKIKSYITAIEELFDLD